MVQFPFSWDMENGFLRAWWFDPLTATLGFGAFIHWYWYEERKRGLSSNNDIRDTLGMWGFGPLYNSLASYWVGIFLWKCVVPPAASIIPDGIPDSASSLLYLLLEIVTGIVLYDAVFFFLHWSMHELPFLRRWHERHHEEQSVEARDVLRHSVMDGSLQVLVNILVQRTNPWGSTKTRLARFLHNLLVTWMLTESHTSSPHPYIWRRYFVGVREHRLHHSHQTNQHARRRYQQFFGYLDNTLTFLTSTSSRSWRCFGFNKSGLTTTRARVKILRRTKQT